MSNLSQCHLKTYTWISFKKLTQDETYMLPCVKQIVCIVKATVFPVVMDGIESWTIKKVECRRIDSL